MLVEVNDNDDDADQAVADAAASPPAEAKESNDDDDRGSITADVSTSIEAGESGDDESRSVTTTDATSTGWGDGLGWGSAGTRGWGGTSTALSGVGDVQTRWADTRWGVPATPPPPDGIPVPRWPVPPPPSPPVVPQGYVG